MLQLDYIEKYFWRGSPREIHALKGISLSIEDGEYVVIIGSNGSGKSTLLNALAGTFSVDSGSILFDGKDVSQTHAVQRSRYISRVFQDPAAGTAAELSILENFRLASLRTSAKKLKTGTNQSFRNKISEIISALGLGLENKIDQPMGNLSGGQRQALTLLMATMDDSSVLLMDEPASALDPATAVKVMELANEIILSKRLTAILVTHDLKAAVKYGSRLIMLSEGKVLHDVKGSEKKQLTAALLLEWFQ